MHEYKVFILTSGLLSELTDTCAMYANCVFLFLLFKAINQKVSQLKTWGLIATSAVLTPFLALRKITRGSVC